MGGTALRVLLAGLLTGVAVGAPATPVAADDTAANNGFVVRASLGYGNVVRAGEWAPLTVDVTSLGPGFDGTIVVIAQQGQSFRFGSSGSSAAGSTYEFSLSLAPHEHKRLSAAVLVPTSGNFAAELVQGGKVLAGDNTMSQPAQSLIGVLSDQPNSIVLALRSLNLGGRPVPSVVTLSSGDLPDSEPVLRAFNLIVIDDVSTDLLTGSQRRALVDYVAMGGNLLLGSGVAWHRTLSGIDASLLPLQPTGTQVVDMDATIPGEDYRPINLLPSPSANPVVSPRPSPTATLSPSPSPTAPTTMPVEIVTGSSGGGSAWLAEHGTAFMLEKSVGAGGVGMSTFDWSAAPIAGWPNAASLLRLAAGRLLLGEPQTPRSVGGQMSWLFGAPPQVPNRSQNDPIATAVITLPNRDLPSLPLTALFVLVYGLLIFPVNYVLLRALGRLHLAWITLPAMAVVLMSGVYVTGLNSKARIIQRNEITVVYTEPDWTRSLHMTYGAVFAPSQGDYHAQVANDGLIAPLDQGTGNGEVHVRPGSATVDTVNAGAFSMHGFLSESIQETPGITAVAGSAGPLAGGSGTALSVHIHNGSSVSLSGGYVVAGVTAQPVPDLAAGASADVVVAARQFVGQVPAQLYAGSSPYAGSGPLTPSQVEGNERNAVLGALLPTNNFNQFGAGIRPAGPVFIGWSTDAQGPQRVNGTTPVIRNETVYVVPVELNPLSLGPFPRGLIAARMVESNANTGTGVYEFVVPSQADPVRSVVIQYTNPGYVYPPNSGLAFDYWEWTEGRWSRVGTSPYNSNPAGTLTLPIAAVDPASRLVRLRMPNAYRVGASQIYVGAAS